MYRSSLVALFFTALVATSSAVRFHDNAFLSTGSSGSTGSNWVGEYDPPVENAPLKIPAAPPEVPVKARKAQDSNPAPPEKPGTTRAAEQEIREEGTEMIMPHLTADHTLAVEFPNVCVHGLPVPAVGALAEKSQFFWNAWIRASGTNEPPADGLDATQFAYFYKKIANALPIHNQAARELQAEEAVALKNRALLSVTQDPLRSRVSWLEFWVYQCNDGKRLELVQKKIKQAKLAAEEAAKLAGQTDPNLFIVGS
eukprot:GILI01003842.1.p1 GENE.GILI01003842.1~~GILI01003842.1.p1  ORF type:complete len:255 (-),score=88.36 GILI01003842.1:237-1001(-)